jgi:hypothetical protein
MIAEALQDKSANNQGSIASNETHAIQSNDKEICDATDQIIQESVASAVVSHTEKLAGKTTGGFVSTSVSIDARMSDKIKSKIWSKQFIDFATLLSKDNKSKSKLCLQVEQSDYPGKLTIYQLDTNGESELTVSTMHDWITAWNRFSAIYCLKFPNEQPKLAKHFEAVRNIADARGNWQTYDFDFRTLVAQGEIEWGGGDIHMEFL